MTLVIAEAHPDEVHHHVLHGDLDLLALAGGVALHEGGEDADHAVHARCPSRRWRARHTWAGRPANPVTLMPPPMAWAIGS